MLEVFVVISCQKLEIELMLYVRVWRQMPKIF